MMESMRNLHIVLLIGVTCVLQVLSQVCPYSDQACICQWEEVTCHDLQQIPPLNTGVNVSQVTDLTFQHGNISSISSNSLPPGLRTIFLFRHPLTNISDDAFDTSATSLQGLYISGAKFNKLPTALKKLTTLTSLQISDTRIEEWDTGILQQIATSLKTLDLNDVGLSAWPSWFSDFHLLLSVDVSFNSLTSIPDDAFSSIKDSLTRLNLAGTGLTNIPQALFTLSSLTTLFLIGNNFTDVSDIDTITGSPFAQKLSSLYLDLTELTTIGNLSALTSLRVLSLASNRISDISAGSLPSSLTSLDLSTNTLSSVPQVVASLSRLSDLSLAYNLITSIEATSFPSSLTILYLSFNNLTIITNTTFRNLNLLQTLYLDNNPISSISPSAFSDLVSLRYIYITRSQLTEIPLAFTVLNNQIYIDFSTDQPLSCPCPAPQELVQWFNSLNGPSFTSACSNGQSVDSYLTGQCGQQSATP